MLQALRILRRPRARAVLDGIVSRLPVRAEARGKEGVVVDHACTHVWKIPTEWLNRAKKISVHYACTSHGSQIIAGLQHLRHHVDPVRYSVEITMSGESVIQPPEQDPPAVRMYVGNPPKAYVRPEDYWDGKSAMDRTRAVARTGLFNVSMWAWCGQQSWNSAWTVRRYLKALDLLEQEFPAMRFVYMTGHTDGGSAILARNNGMVREYCRRNDKVLFDFADLESWDPEGKHYPDTTDACTWCEGWCTAHPEDAVSLPKCPHTHGFSGVLKARAFWWMMARLAGWVGEKT